MHKTYFKPHGVDLVLEVLVDVVDKLFLVQHKGYKNQLTWGAVHFPRVVHMISLKLECTIHIHVHHEIIVQGSIMWGGITILVGALDFGKAKRFIVL